MDAFGVLDEVLGDYENFVKGFLEIKDGQIRSKVEKEIADGLLWPEPWLALNPAFESGGTVSDLVGKSVLDPSKENSHHCCQPTFGTGSSASTTARSVAADGSASGREPSRR
jgi:hypothetical protein